MTTTVVKIAFFFHFGDKLIIRRDVMKNLMTPAGFRRKCLSLNNSGKKKGFLPFTGIASVPGLSFGYLPLTTPGTSDE